MKKKVLLFVLCFLSLTYFSFAGETVITTNTEKDFDSSNYLANDKSENRNSLVAQIITSIITVIVAYITGAVPSLLTKKYENAKIKKEKLEEFYIETTDWYNSCFIQVSMINLIFNRKWRWEDFDNYITQNPIKNGYLKSEIDIFLYFPELKDNYEEVRKSIQDLFVYSYEIRNNNDLISCRKIYNELAKKSSQSFDSFKEKMESIAIMIK